MKPIILLDASALKKSSCSLNFYRTLIEGYRGKVNDDAIEFGSGFHRAAEVLEKTGGNIGLAMQEGVKYFRETPRNITKKYLTETYLHTTIFTWYNNIWSKDSFDILRDTNCTEEKDGDKTYTYDEKGKPLVEMKFAIPYYDSEVCTILLSGTMDKLSLHRTSKLLAVGDYKTSSTWDIGKKLKAYEMDGQLYFYVTAAKLLIEQSDPSSILYKYRGQAIGAYIDGIFVGPNDKFEFERSEVFVFPKHKLIEYDYLLGLKCKEIENMIRNQYVPREGLINDACRQCSFITACGSPDKQTEEFVLQRNFIKVPYNPLTFGKSLL